MAYAGTSQLQIYNLALGLLSARKLASVSEARESRRVLDEFYDSVVAYCLERKMWNFATRAASLDASTDVVPEFGPKFAFALPDDWVRTVMVSTDQTFSIPLTAYLEETGYIYADFTPIFLRWVSNDPGYGMNLAKWPASYEDYVSTRLAMKACRRITGSGDLLKGREGLVEQEEKARKVADANCAMNNAPAYLPPGTWTQARRGIMSRMAGAGDNPGGSLLG